MPATAPAPFRSPNYRQDPAFPAARSVGQAASYAEYCSAETIQRVAKWNMATPYTAPLERTTFCTSRLLDFTNKKELTAQVGHPEVAWPVVILKELADNAIDAEEASMAPAVSVVVDERGITVEDNGPGIPADVVGGVLDFSVRVSSR
jgi:hypothetical protein